jgi:hypothetical protein
MSEMSISPSMTSWGATRLPGVYPLLEYKSKRANPTEDDDETLLVPLRILALFTVALTGCEVIGDIFKAGVWVGVLLVLLVIGIIVWLVTRTKA